MYDSFFPFPNSFLFTMPEGNNAQDNLRKIASGGVSIRFFQRQNAMRIVRTLN
jgi:hypothetical protein